ncbi:MAG TPA: hypothetical protein VJR89_38410 [Polyangiales bacterium]|nr:hypothetical protein [Polyangiales bacterium]
MQTLRYDITAQGVMVEVVTDQPPSQEWTAMMRYMVENAARIRCVLVLNHGDSGPTATQRSELKETLTHLQPKLPVAILTDSRVARAVMTAILWITGKHEETGVFAGDELSKASKFLQLDEAAQEEVGATIRRLSDQ